LDRIQQALLSDSFDQNDLIQVNVTGVYARFCDIPMANSFFTNVKKSNMFRIVSKQIGPTTIMA